MISLKRKIFVLAMMIGAVIFSLSGCYTPSPLYGTWMNNEGDSITFASGEEQTFTAKFYNATGIEVSYNGKWECRSNILVLTLEKPASSSGAGGGESTETEGDENTESGNEENTESGGENTETGGETTEPPAGEESADPAAGDGETAAPETPAEGDPAVQSAREGEGGDESSGDPAESTETTTLTKLCEWDIRGDMLFLKWTDNYNEKRIITLYHVAK